MKQQDLSVGKPYIDYTNEQLLKPGFLKGIYGSENIERFIREKVHGEKYNPAVEKNLLILLGSNADTIEDYILTIKDKQRYELSLLEIYTLEYYTKKIIAANGIDKNIDINMFEHSRGVDNGSAGSRGNYIKINNNADNQKVSNILHTIHHETSHCVVFNMLENESLEKQFELDEDIAKYCKDKIILDVLHMYNEGEEYLKENYSNISYEFDADFRALSMHSKLFRTTGEIDLKAEEIYSKYPQKDVEYAYIKQLSYDNGDERIYEGETYSLDEFFENVMNTLPKSQAKEIYDRYPAIRFEYNFNPNMEPNAPNIERKSIQEMLQQYNTAKQAGNQTLCKLHIAHFISRVKDYQTNEVAKEEFKEIIKADEQLALEVHKGTFLASVPTAKYTNNAEQHNTPR